MQALLLLSVVAMAAAAPEKRMVLDTIAAEQQKFINCETKSSKAECDQCCKTTQWGYPGEEIGCLGTCYALPMTSGGSRKRMVLDTIAAEQQKFVNCETKSSKAECDQCCKTTQWGYPGEEIGCLGTCYALPMISGGSRKRMVLDTIAAEQQKFINCETKSSKAECDQCCKTTQWGYPGEEIGCLGTCYALPMTSGGQQKRFVLDTIAAEQHKFAVCETKGSREECSQCCRTTDWSYPAEDMGCLALCYSLPVSSSGSGSASTGTDSGSTDF